MSPLLLGFCLGISTMIGVSVLLGVIMLLKARDADARGKVRPGGTWRSPSAWRHTET